MADIFVSYAAGDRLVAERLAAALSQAGWSVFWDRRVEVGSQWSDDIQHELHRARCVLVLWSRESRGSLWVRGEAAAAYDGDVYLPVRLDDAGLPRLFGPLQALSIARFVENGELTELDALLAEVRTRLGPLAMYGNLERVAPGERVEIKHLHLVHSCWRVDRETRYGRMPYQIHVILFGHPSALDRVTSVDYSLPGYPAGHTSQRSESRERLFECKELANGFSIVQATVHVAQPSGPGRLHLSRLVNMSESGPRLLDDFVLRSPFKSNLVAKMHSLPHAVEQAKTMLTTMGDAEVAERLVVAGTPPLMAEEAVRQARRWLP